MNEPNEKTQPKTVEQIYEAALKLSDEERELLVAMLEQNDSSGWASPAIERAWMDEVERREQLVREGKMETYAWEDVRERVLARLAALRN